MGAQSAVYADADRMTMYQLDVLGVDATDVVRSAGGWLFDRVMAGWDVQVTLTRACDVRPLQILGLRIGECRDDPVALAVAGELSGAARAFKAQALAAAGLDWSEPVPFEAFRGDNRSLLLIPPDLTPV